MSSEWGEKSEKVKPFMSFDGCVCVVDILTDLNRSLTVL